MSKRTRKELKAEIRRLTSAVAYWQDVTTEYVDRVEDAEQRLAALIRDLEDLTRKRPAAMQIEPGSVSGMPVEHRLYRAWDILERIDWHRPPTTPGQDDVTAETFTPFTPFDWSAWFRELASTKSPNRIRRDAGLTEPAGLIHMPARSRRWWQR